MEVPVAGAPIQERHSSAPSRRSQAKRAQKSRRSAVRRSPPTYPRVWTEKALHNGTCTSTDCYEYLSRKDDPRIKRWLESEIRYANESLQLLADELHRRVAAQAESLSTSRQSRHPRERVEVEEKNATLILPPGVTPDLFRDLEQQLYEEMKRRWKETDASLPVKDRNFWYYSRVTKGDEHPQYCRAPYNDVSKRLLFDFAALLRCDPNAQLPRLPGETVVLDVNELQRTLGLSFVEVGDMDVSPHESQLLVSVDATNSGSEEYTILVIDLEMPSATITTPTAEEWAEIWKLEGGTKRLVQKRPSGTPKGLRAEDLSREEPRKRFFASTKAPAQRQPQRQRLRPLPRDDPTASAQGGRRDSVSDIPLRQRIVRAVDCFSNSSDVLWHAAAASERPRGFLYVAMDETKRPFQLLYHSLEHDPASEHADLILFEEDDPAYWLTSIGYSEDKKYLLFCTASKLSEEWWYLPADEDIVAAWKLSRTTSDGGSHSNDEENPAVNGVPCGEPSEGDLGNGDVAAASCASQRAEFVPLFRPLMPRRDVLEYDVAHIPSWVLSVESDCVAAPAAGSTPGGGQEGGALTFRDGWIVVSNRDECRNFTIDFVVSDGVALPPLSPAVFGRTPTRNDAVDPEWFPFSQSSWLPLFQYDDEVKIDGVSATAHFLLVHVREKGFPTCYLVPMAALRACQVRRSKEWRLRSDREKQLPLQPPLSLRDSDVAVSLRDLVISYLICATNGALERRVDDWREVISVDAHPGTEDFDCREVRISVTHMIFPAQSLVVFVNDEATCSCDCSASSSSTSRKGFAAAAAAASCVSSALQFVENVQHLRSEHVRGGYDPDAYTVRRVFVPSTSPNPPFFTASKSDEQTNDEGSNEEGVNGTPQPQQKSQHRGTVPMSLCYRNDRYAAGVNPCMITAYGSYGDCTDPEFSAERLVLLDRGIVYAIANVRGGGELGRVWRDEGRMQHRAESVRDFVDCSRYLVEHAFCHPKRLCSLGASAGGTIVAAAMEFAPGLYRSVVALVPFVDCLSTMLDPSIPLTAAEWEEWGNPMADAAAFRTIASYSPVNNVEKLVVRDRVVQERLEAISSSDVDGATHGVLIAAPQLLFLESGFGDPRVPHWEPMKLGAHVRHWIDMCTHNSESRRPNKKKNNKSHTSLAKAHELNKGEDNNNSGGGVGDASDDLLHEGVVDMRLLYDGSLVLHKCNLKAGHGGSSGRYEQLRELATEYTAVLVGAYGW